MDHIKLFSNQVELSSISNGNLQAKFILCDFSVNKNGVQLDRSNIENWMSTIIHQPLVGKIVRNVATNTDDFSGHNMKVTVLSDGSKRVEFDTNAYGSFTSVNIEEIDGAEYLVATAEIWARYPKVIELISNRVQTSTLNSSWEIAVSEYHMDGPVKVITSGEFTGHCLLGKNHAPAFDCSRLLEVAEEDYYDEEFEAAISEVQEEQNMPNVITEEVSEVVVEETEVSEETTVVQEEPVVENEVSEEQPEVEEEISENEIAQLTSDDIGRMIHEKLSDCEPPMWPTYIFPEEHIVWARNWHMNELEFVEVQYQVNENSVELVGDKKQITLVASPKQFNSLISEKDEAIANASIQISEFKNTISELSVYKEEHDKIVAEQEEAEKCKKKKALCEYAVKSGFIAEKELSSDETISEYIESLNESAIKQLIAERFMASINNKQPEVSEEAVVSKAVIETDDVRKINIAMMFANKKKN